MAIQSTLAAVCDDLTEAEVSAAMDEVILNNIFQKNPVYIENVEVNM